MTEHTPVAIPPGHLELLRASGVDGVQHDSHIPFLAHLAGVRQLLNRWGASDTMQDIGLFHSVYGTEFFDPQLQSGPSREAVRALIGGHAERVVWLWCNVRRASIEAALDVEQPTLEHRDGRRIEVSRDEVRDLVDLWCADACEQLDRLEEDETDFSHGLRHLIRAASPAARRAVEAELARRDGS